MISEAPTKAIIKRLKAAGFTPRKARGSHTMWISPSGNQQVSVPDGHRTVSPGVHRQVNKAIEAAKEEDG
ncbi:type II toxin-antitoxin system HicA family toxin [Gordonia sp. N1V]|uniref:type II toxin-antitoxin system HicA family toxin n=1 Tax=Gordonia sp. N1V TaxID=3034163 RepID=UPI0023E0E1A3|nr:type II toxin-antitoxin system HicA family toxin [Gordonia sp. N1V]MDF3280900.1 type II toxin-antitoxin system HicA family toxin [Gordonia sp. N1V]